MVPGRRVVDLGEYRAMGAWGQHLEQFLSWLRAGDRSEGTIAQRRYHLQRFARSYADPWAVTVDDLSTYLGAHGWGNSTRRSARAALRTFYGWAQATGRQDTNPAALLAPAKPKPGRPRPASEIAVHFALEDADERVRWMVLLGARVGLRCCEIAVVHRDDVIHDLVGVSLLVHGKGGRERVVPLPDAIAAMILRVEGYLFPGRVDGHLSAAYVSKRLSRALPRGVTGHQLRHRFASRAYSADGDIRAVQELLGHASVATTQIYTAVPTDHLRRAIEAAA